jgi:hypothetical protein
LPKAEELYEQLKFDDKTARRIADELVSAVRRADTDRTELKEKWHRALALYEGKRPEKNFPWPGAANVHVPLVSSHVSAIHARFMTTFFTPEPFWKVRSKNPELQDFADAATEYLDWSRQNEFPWYEVIRDWSLDVVKLGTGVLKITWKRRRGPMVRYDEKYNVTRDDALLDDRPNVEAVEPEDFIWPAGFADVQEAPWVCHVLHYTPGEIRRLAKEGFFPNADAVNRVVPLSTTQDDSRLEIAKQDFEGIRPSNREIIDIYEIWARDVYEGVDGDVQFFIEPSTGTILRANPNPYFHQKRPFVVGRLEVRSHRLPGLGVSDQIGDLNDEINTVHNQTINATTASIVQMYGVRAGSPAEAALQRIWPSKVIPFSTKDDVSEIGLGPLKVNSLQLEEYARTYAERRTGISDFSLGREPTPSRRGTATGTLAIIQEGNRKFDHQIRDLRGALSEAGTMLLELLQQMNPRGIHREVLGPDGTNFITLRLLFPQEPIRKAVHVEVIAGTAAVNRQVQRQDALTLFQIVMSFYTQVFQLAQLLAQPGLPPPLIELAIQLGRGGRALMSEILQTFENRRKDELLPDLEEVFANVGAFGAAQSAALQSGVQGFPGSLQTPGPPGGGGGAQRPPQQAGPGGPGGPGLPAGTAAGLGTGPAIG